MLRHRSIQWAGLIREQGDGWVVENDDAKIDKGKGSLFFDSL